jgi:prepilin-type N-terminal cleavage/methylation domain-containing protein
MKNYTNYHKKKKVGFWDGVWKSIRNKKFTLIELLIVVAIIAILLSILMPGLNKARYKAKLAVCLSNLKQNHLAISIYAKNNNRLYPRLEGNQDRWSVKYASNDRRDLLKSVFQSVDEPLTCPLTGSMPSSRKTSNATRIYINYDFYAGTYLNISDPNSGMFRINLDTTYKGEEFSVLMGDQLRTST